MPSTEPECVLRLAVEGGGVNFFRQWNADGAWRFTFKGSSMGFDLDDELTTWSSTDAKTPDGYMTLDEAIAGFSSDADWVHWSAVRIHPDYKQYMWSLREKTVLAMVGPELSRARRYDGRWARACGQRPPARPTDEDRPRRVVVLPGGTLDVLIGVSIAVFEHQRKESLSTEEMAEFEATVIRVLEKRHSDRRELSRAQRQSRSSSNSAAPQ